MAPSYSNPSALLQFRTCAETHTDGPDSQSWHTSFRLHLPFARPRVVAEEVTEKGELTVDFVPHCFHMLAGNAKDRAASHRAGGRDQGRPPGHRLFANVFEQRMGGMPHRG